MTTLRLTRGDDRTVRTPVFTTPGGTEPYPWASSRVFFTAKTTRDDPDSAAIIRLDSDVADEIDLSTDGIALSKIPGDATRQLPNLETRLFFDVQVRNPDGEIFTVDSGELYVDPETTIGPDEGTTRTPTAGLLASVRELELYLEDDDLDPERAELFLAIASGEVRSATGNLFTYTEADELLLNGKGSTVLLLPHAPILRVTELVEAPGRSEELELDGPDADRPGFEWSEDGILRRIDGRVFARRFRYYRAVVDHGYRTIPVEVRGVVVRSAAGGFENPEGIRQESLGRYSYTVAGADAGIGLFPADLRTLAPYDLGSRRPLAASSSSGSGS